MSRRSDPLWGALARRDLVAVVTHLSALLALPPDVACPGCGGCLPGEGPDERVCRCGSWWATGDAREAVTA